MAETIIIDVRTNYTDNMSPAIEASGRAMDRMEASMKRMGKVMDSLNGGGKFQASFDLQDNASKQIDSILAGVRRLSGISTIRFVVDIIDKVTQPLQNIMSMVMNTGQNVGSMIMQRGWTRVTELDAAKAKLSGLGNTAADIKEISQNASDAVTGTAYSLNEAVTAAASAVAAGLKPGVQLKQYLTDIADVAGISGRSMGEIGSIMNAVVTTGKAQNDTLQQFAERGLPIYQWLAKTLNTTEDQISGMAKNGEIGIEHLQAAIQSNVAGAAQEMGDKTILGVIANINSAYAKLGEAIIGASDDQASLAGQAHEFLLAYKTDVNLLKAPLAELGKSMASVVAQFRPQAIEMMNSAFEGMKARLEDLNAVMKTPEFQNADLFGKMKIAWDTLIGDPFSQWWESKARPMVMEKMNSLGESIGQGLSTILKGIFSWNQGGGAGDAVGEATSIGMSFANGFLQGFDGSGVASAIANSIKTALMDVLSSVFSGKFGGSTLLNGLFLAPFASSAIKLFSGLMGAGKMIGGAKQLLGGGAATQSIAGAASGAGLFGKFGLGAGAGLGSKLLGFGAVGGGLIGGVSALSGISDMVTASKETNKEVQDLQRAKGMLKLGGAGIGALIGSVIPGLGTLIGAGIGSGIGGLAGWFGGKKLEEARNATNDIADDSQKYAVAMKDAERHMARLKLSTSDINKMVTQVIGDANYGKMKDAVSGIKSASDYTEAAASNINTLASYNNRVAAGIPLSKDDLSGYAETASSTATNLVEALITYGSGMTDLLNNWTDTSDLDMANQAIYRGINYYGLLNDMVNDYSEDWKKSSERLEKLKSNMGDQVTQALSDGVLTNEEQKQISATLASMQQMVEESTGITGEANRDVLRRRYGGDTQYMSPESYAQYSQALFQAIQEDQQALYESEAQAYSQIDRMYTGKKASDLKDIVSISAIDREANLLGQVTTELNAQARKIYQKSLDEYSNLYDVTRATEELSSGVDGAVYSLQDVNKNAQNQEYGSALYFDQGMENALGQYATMIQQLGGELGTSIPSMLAQEFKDTMDLGAASGASQTASLLKLGYEIGNNLDSTSKDVRKAADAARSEWEDAAANGDELARTVIQGLNAYEYMKNVVDTEIPMSAINEAAESGDWSHVQELMAGLGGKEEAADEAGETATAPTEYTVEKGDSMWGIARKIFGREPTAEEVQSFIAANEGILNGNPNLIYEGQVMNTTPLTGDAGAEAVEEAAAQAESALEKRQRIQEQKLAEAERNMGEGLTWRTDQQKMQDGKLAAAEGTMGTIDQYDDTMAEKLRRNRLRKLAERQKIRDENITKTFGEEGLRFDRRVQESPDIDDDYKQLTADTMTTLGNIGASAHGWFERFFSRADTTEKQLALADRGGSEPSPAMSEWDTSTPKFSWGGLGRAISEGLFGMEAHADEVVKPQVSGGAPSFGTHYGSGGFTPVEKLYTGETSPTGETAPIAVAPMVSSVDMSRIQPEIEAEAGANVIDVEVPVNVIPQMTGEEAAAYAEQAISSMQGQIDDMMSNLAPDGSGADTSNVFSGMDFATPAAQSRATAESEINGALSGITIPQISLTAPVTVTPDVSVNQTTITVGALSGGTGSASVTVGNASGGEAGGHAAGGLISSAELSWLAEEGYPEMVIPFAPHRRSRALSLLAQAEDALGVSRHANGGIVGGMLPGGHGDSESDTGSSHGNGTVNVGGITFSINTSGGGDIVSQIQGRSAEITEIVTNALADALEQAYENTPLAAG